MLNRAVGEWLVAGGKRIESNRARGAVLDHEVKPIAIRRKIEKKQEGSSDTERSLECVSTLSVIPKRVKESAES